MEQKVVFAIMKAMSFDLKKNVRLHLTILVTIWKVVGGIKANIDKYRPDVASIMGCHHYSKAQLVDWVKGEMTSLRFAKDLRIQQVTLYFNFYMKLFVRYNEQKISYC